MSVAGDLLQFGFEEFSIVSVIYLGYFLMHSASAFGDNCLVLYLLCKVNEYDSWCLILSFVFSMLRFSFLRCYDELDLLRCYDFLWCCYSLFYLYYNNDVAIYVKVCYIFVHYELRCLMINFIALAILRLMHNAICFNGENELVSTT